APGAPRPPLRSRGPGPACGARVEPHVEPTAGDAVRYSRAWTVGQHERGARRIDHVEHVLDEPRRIAELERHPNPRRGDSNEPAEPVEVCAEARRQLHQKGSELAPETLGAGQEELHGLGTVLEPPDVGEE